MSHTYSKEAKASRAKKMKSYNAAEPKKVDSSDWTPAEPLNADVKTGLRPISKRKFKRGGKVVHKIEGAHSKMRHDRKARKSGGKSGEMPTVDRFVNRDMNKANDYRDGKKHVGGMKKGGRAGKDAGGATTNLMNPVMAAGNRINAMNTGANVGLGGINPGLPTGAAGKSILRSKALGFKKGGEAKHPDVAEDKKLIKKMVKPSAMKREEHCWGGKAEGKKNQGGGVFSGNSKEKIPGAVGGRKAKMGGGGFRSELTQYEKARRPAVEAADDYLMDSDNNEEKLRNATRDFERAADETGYSNRKHGGRSKHAKGGKVGKGKTSINIVIAPHGGQPQGQPQPAGGMMPPQPVPQPNKPPMPGAPMGGMPMGMDPNLALLAAKGGVGQQQPPMQPPMGRKTGGRVARTEHVINHAAGGGLGRLEKIKAYGHKGK